MSSRDSQSNTPINACRQEPSTATTVSHRRAGGAAVGLFSTANQDLNHTPSLISHVQYCDRGVLAPHSLICQKMCATRVVVQGSRTMAFEISPQPSRAHARGASGFSNVAHHRTSHSPITRHRRVPCLAFALRRPIRLHAGHHVLLAAVDGVTLRHR